MCVFSGQRASSLCYVNIIQLCCQIKEPLKVERDVAVVYVQTVFGFTIDFFSFLYKDTTDSSTGHDQAHSRCSERGAAVRPV